MAEDKRKFTRMTATEIIQAKTLSLYEEPLAEIAGRLGRSTETIKRAIKGNTNLDPFVCSAKQELEEKLKGELEGIVKAKELENLKVKKAIMTEGTELLLAKIRRHPESIGLKELAGAVKDVWTMDQVEDDKPTDILKLEDADPHAIRKALAKIQSESGGGDDSEGNAPQEAEGAAD